MLFMVLIYTLVPIAALYGLLRIFFKPRVSAMVTANVCIVVIVLGISMIAGLCVSAIYKPTAYWKAFDLAPTIMDGFSNKYLVGENIWAMLLTPFVGFAQFVAWYFEVWAKHWTVALIATHLIGLFCIERFSAVVFDWTTDRSPEKFEYTGG